MCNLNYKEDFFKNNDFSDSIEKAYNVVFKKIKPIETQLNKDVKEFNKEELFKVLKILSSKSYHSINVKWTLLKNYLIANENDVYTEITQEDLKKFIKNTENTSRYISRNTLQNRVKNLINPIDQAILLLLFEGLYGYKYDELLKLKVNQIDTKKREITLENRIIKISNYTNEVLQDAITKKEYYKAFTTNDITTNESYLVNPSSPYLIKTKPSARTCDGKLPLGVEGFKSKISKLTKDIGLEKTSPLSIYHSGIIEKILEEEKEKGKELSLSEIKKTAHKLGATKLQPAIIKNAMSLYKKNYKK